MAIERERRKYLSAANVLTILGMVGMIAGVWAAMAADNADTKRRITNVEVRQEEDRKNTKEAIEKVDKKIDQVQTGVQQILIEIQGMKSTQQERARLERERERRQ